MAVGSRYNKYQDVSEYIIIPPVLCSRWNIATMFSWSTIQTMLLKAPFHPPPRAKYYAQQVCVYSDCVHCDQQ